MKDRIIERLKEFENKNGVTILYACESGSRAWGFPSMDSDYDVRFFYANTPEWYLSIDQGRDVIEDVGKVLDFSGWEIRKSLRLFRSSNAGLYEKLQSPIIYWDKGGFREKLSTLMVDFYNPVNGIHHYLSLVHNFHQNELSRETAKLKKYFYVLRSILAARWIREIGGVPPMEFKKLRVLESNKNWNELVDRWLILKSSGDESLVVSKSDLIDSFIVSELTLGTDYAKSLKTNKREDSEILNTLLRNWVR